MKRFSTHLFSVFVFSSLFTTSLAAQSSTGSLSGTVQDEQSRIISSARVTLIDPQRGQSRTTETDGNGSFTFSQLPPSTYELSVVQTGFAKAQQPGIIINANDQRSVTIALRVSALGESVIVTSSVPLVSEAPAVATSLDRQFIENQPLNGRSFQTLINLAPGIVMAPASLVSQGQFSVNGQRTGANYFTVDGVGANFGMPSATSPYEGSGGSVPSFSSQGGTSSLASVDAVQEFTVQTSTYAPEYGRQPGAQVAIVTRSGTNALHGNAFNYFRNDKLDANNWFGNYNGINRPPLRQNDFGFTIGGPVLIPRVYNGKNRTFFFASYEGLRLIQPVILTGVRVPSLAARQNATGALKSLLEAYPLPVADPLPNTPAETPYSARFSNPSTLNATSFRIDHSLSTRFSVFGRFNHAPSETRQRARYSAASFVAVLPNDTQTTTLGSTMMFTPAVNNDLRFNWSQARASQEYVQDTFGGAKLLSNDILFPSFAPQGESLYYLTIGGNDENTISPGTFSKNTQRQINIVNTTSWNIGSHALKFGVDYRRLAPSIGGRTYSKVLTVPTITQLATGIVPNAEIRQTAGYLEPCYHNFSVFAQDAWKIRQNLTLTYGLRWEVNPAQGGTQILTVRGLDNPPSATLAPEGTKLYQTTYNNFAPRIGVAYQPFAGKGTVIRGGFGMFYDLGYAFTGSALTPTNFPFSRSLSATNVPIQDPILFQEAGPLNMNPPYPRLFAYKDGYQLPYTLQYSFAIEQPLGTANSFSVSYVGSAARRLARVESLRPAILQNPAFTRIDLVNNDAYSDYNSLQAQFKRRMSRGLQALLAYTWAKSLDTVSDDSSLQAPSTRLPVSSERGPSSFDIAHQFSGSASYEIPTPFSNPAARAVLGGFSLDSVVRLRTGAPVTIATGFDPMGLGVNTVARPDLIPGQPLYLDGSGYPGGRIFNRNAFDADTPLAEGRQGTLGRNTLRGFGLQQVDLSVRRRFKVTEYVGLEFRADAFNLFNRANFSNPSGVLTNANFGRSTQILSNGLGGQNPLFQIGGPRSIQLALRLQF